ncbi:MAG: hypothetical protein QXX49_06245 [Candidatus Caldarchaeum sp.]
MARRRVSCINVCQPGELVRVLMLYGYGVVVERWLKISLKAGFTA